MGTTKKQAAVKKPRKAVIQKKASGQGAAKMSAEANKTLEEHGAEIVGALLSSMRKGNVSGIKLLCELAAKDEQLDKEGPKRRHPSIAKRLATEPQWNGEMSEADAETSYGGREPEG